MMGRPPSSPMGREKMKNPLLLLLLINSLHHKCPFPETTVQLPSSSPPLPPPPPGCCSLRQRKEKIREILPTSTKEQPKRKGQVFCEILSCAPKDGKSKRELRRTLSRQRQKIIFLRVSHHTNLHPHPQPSIHPSIRTKSLQIRSS